MRSVQSVVAVFMALVMGLFSVGCGTASNLVTLLNAVADAASVATVVAAGLAATGTISQTDATAVATYATEVSTAVNQSVTELGTTDTNPVKITDITGYFAAAIAPNFSGGSALVPVIQAIVTTVTQFISQLTSSTVLTAARVAPTVSVSLVLTRADKSLLKKTKATATATIASAAKLKTAVPAKK